MHSYSIDTEERIKILSIMGIISVYIKNSLEKTISEFLPNFFVPLSALFVFSILFLLYNHFIWKWVCKLPLGQVTPNLNGLYTGVLKSSYDEYNEPHKITMSIKQSWTKILITLHTETSKSCSKTASLLLNTKCDPMLLYFYQNDPHIDSKSSMEIHYGTCEHTYNKENKTLDAWYYSGRGRNTTGTIQLTKNT